MYDKWHLVVVDVFLVLVVEPHGLADARLLPPLVDVVRGPLHDEDAVNMMFKWEFSNKYKFKEITVLLKMCGPEIACKIHVKGKIPIKYPYITCVYTIYKAEIRCNCK